MSDARAPLADDAKTEGKVEIKPEEKQNAFKTKSIEEIDTIMKARRELFNENLNGTLDLPIEIAQEAQAQNQQQVDEGEEKDRAKEAERKLVAEIEIEVEKNTSAEIKLDASEIIFDKEKFLSDYKDHPSLKGKNLSEWWDNLFGNISKPPRAESNLYLNRKASKITQKALEIILDYPVLFSTGIEFYHIHGFKLHTNKTVYFDKVVAEEPLSSIHFEIGIRKKTYVDSKADNKAEDKQIRHPKDNPNNQWWNLLYEKHKESSRQNPDELNVGELARCFKSFLDEIKELNLRLPPLTNKNRFLQNATSMPVILGRVLSLIKNPMLKNTEERQAQLDIIPELSLASTGAIRALADARYSQSGGCRFVTPQMNCEVKHFDEDTGYSYQSPYMSRSVQIISEKANLSYARQMFWRYVALQGKGLPLSFYAGKKESKTPSLKDGVAQIEESKLKDPKKEHPYKFLASKGGVALIEEGKFSDSEKVYLYEFLASISTGIGLVLKQVSEGAEKKEYKNKTEEEIILLEWAHFIANVKNFPSKLGVLRGTALQIYALAERRTITSKCLTILAQLMILPPIRLLNLMFDLMRNSINKKGIQEGLKFMSKAFKKLNDIFSALLKQGIDPSIVYEGMRYCLQSPDDFNPENPDESSFLRYLSVLEDILNLSTSSRYQLSIEMQTLLVKSHAVFNIQGAFDVNSLVQECKKRENIGMNLTYKNFLDQVRYSPNNKPQDLLTILDYISEDKKKREKDFAELTDRENVLKEQDNLLAWIDLRPEYKMWGSKTTLREIKPIFERLEKIQARFLRYRLFISDIPSKVRDKLKQELSYDSRYPTEKGYELIRDMIKEKIDKTNLAAHFKLPLIRHLTDSNAGSKEWKAKLMELKRAINNCGLVGKWENQLNQYMEFINTVLELFELKEYLKEDNEYLKECNMLAAMQKNIEYSLPNISRYENHTIQELREEREKGLKEKCELDARQKNPNLYIVDFIESLEKNTTIASIFPNDYLKDQKLHYLKTLLPESIVQLLNQHFKDEHQREYISDIIVLFYKTGINNLRELTRLCLQLKDLADIYQNNVRFQEFLYQWKEYEMQFERKERKECPRPHTVQQLNELLGWMADTRNPNLLESILFQPNVENIDIVNKSIPLYRDIYPWLLRNNARRISDRVSYPMVVDVLLAVPKEEFIQKVEIPDVKSEKNIEEKEDHLFDELNKFLQENTKILLNPESVSPSQEMIQKIGDLREKLKVLKDDPSTFCSYLSEVDGWLCALLKLQESISSADEEKEKREEKKEEQEAKKIEVKMQDEKSIASMEKESPKNPVAVQEETFPEKAATWLSGMFKKASKTVNAITVRAKSILSISDDSFVAKTEPSSVDILGEIKPSTMKKIEKVVKRSDAQDQEGVRKLCIGELERLTQQQYKNRTSYVRYLAGCYHRIYKIVETSKEERKKLDEKESQIEKQQMMNLGAVEALSVVSKGKHKLEKKSNVDDEQHNMSLAQDLFQFMSLASKEPLPKDEKSFMARLNMQLACLEEANDYLKTSELRRLLYYYSAEPKKTSDPKQPKPSDLMEILQYIKSATEENKQILYSLLAKLVGQKDKEKQEIVSQKAFKKLSKNPELLKKVNKHCKHPPYLSLQTLISLLLSDEKTNQDILNQHDLTPFERDPIKNVITLDNLIAQARLFTPTQEMFNDHNLRQFEGLINLFRAMPSSKKITRLQDLKNKLNSGANVDNKMELAALLGELLYATTGQELNHTQYLVVLNALLTEGHLARQVATGEGKSRILLILCAAQCLLGKSVDFVTSSSTLARRDLDGDSKRQPSRPFFKACNIPVQLVDQYTPINDYFKGENIGVNFSSPEDINLFLNKASVEKPGFDWNNNKILILDESDKTIFDRERYAVNYAVPVDARLGDMSWMYPFIMECIQDPSFAHIYKGEDEKIVSIEVYNKIFEVIREKLKKTPENHKEKWAQIKEITNDDIEKWLRAGLVANKLKEDRDYIIEKDQLRLTSKGMRRVSVAIVKKDNELYRGSTFADAVHQCLYARLNAERQAQFRKLPRLEFLEKYSKTPFDIPPENQVVYSTNMSLWYSAYSQVITFTATMGSELEREELQEKLKAMQIVDVPPHQESKLKLSSTFITADETQQRLILIQKAKQAIAANRPVLIICETDTERKQVYEAFKQAAGINPNNLQTFDSMTNENDYNHAIKRAGERGMITIATNIAGRGVDIDAKDNNLYVMATYLPSERDETQIFGRTARQGEEGQARLVLRKAQLEQLAANNDEAFENVDQFIEAYRVKRDYPDMKIRWVLEFAHQFTNALQQTFWNSDLAKDKLQLEPWATFLKQQRKHWTVQWSAIERLLKQSLVHDEKTASEISNRLTTFINTCYQSYNKQFASISANNFQDNLKALIKKLTTPPAFSLSASEPQDKWESAHTGKGVQYKTLFAERRGMWRKFKKEPNWEHAKDFILPSRVLERARLEKRVLNVPLKKKRFANTKAWYHHLTRWQKMAFCVGLGMLILGSIFAIATGVGAIVVGTSVLVAAVTGFATGATYFPASGAVLIGIGGLLGLGGIALGANSYLSTPSPKEKNRTAKMQKSPLSMEGSTVSMLAKTLKQDAEFNQGSTPVQVTEPSITKEPVVDANKQIKPSEPSDKNKNATPSGPRARSSLG